VAGLKFEQCEPASLVVRVPCCLDTRLRRAAAPPLRLHNSALIDPTPPIPPPSQKCTWNDAIQLFGYYGGLHRYGMMATTVLDSSNTLLHAAKAVHATGLPQLVPLQVKRAVAAAPSPPFPSRPLSRPAARVRLQQLARARSSYEPANTCMFDTQPRGLYTGLHARRTRCSSCLPSSSSSCASSCRPPPCCTRELPTAACCPRGCTT
jgi:hypothetical protein